MILRKGNMWDVFGKVDWFLITTNPIVTKQGLAVMGRGIAKQACIRIPTLREDFGTLLNNTKDNLDFPRPVRTIGTYEGQKVGHFMVKLHWRYPATLGIIEDSVAALIDILFSIEEMYGTTIRVALNFPGIGNGKLKREDVLPIIEKLPDNVQVWEYE